MNATSGVKAAEKAEERREKRKRKRKRKDEKKKDEEEEADEDFQPNNTMSPTLVVGTCPSHSAWTGGRTTTSIVTTIIEDVYEPAKSLPQSFQRDRVICTRNHRRL